MPEANGITSATDCHHHWLIESPAGGISRGTCKYCGSVRDFNNDPQASLRNSYRPAAKVTTPTSS